MSDYNGDSAFDTILDAQPDDEGLIQLPLLLIQNDVMLPHSVMPLSIDNEDDANAQAIRHALAHRQPLIYVSDQAIPDEGLVIGTWDDVGCEVAVVNISQDKEHLDILMMQGRQRLQIVAVVQTQPWVLVKARPLAEVMDEERIDYWHDICLDGLSDVIALNYSIADHIFDYVQMIEDMSEFSDVIAAALSLEQEERQTLLREADIIQRLQLIRTYLNREIVLLETQEWITHRAQEEIHRAQRDLFLREQVRLIQEELGEDTLYADSTTALHERLHAAQLPPIAHEQALKELSRLGMMAAMSPEAGVIRTYLDWLLDLPWHERSKDRLQLSYAQRVLNREHFGLDKIKERILEHIAVRKLAGQHMKSPILCFVGPPGVGKTSLGKSIADALGREFLRMSLGGVRDEAEIRGHRRTYIGAMPGRLIQTIKRAGTVNPVFMLDEIDKMAEDYHGDPTAALLEVLDPEQNHAFVDHYLEVPYDLSQVMFIATANDLDFLSEALEDRLEVIAFHAYTEEEKLEIAKRFLIPKQLKAHGLSRRGIHFLDQAILHIIQHYTLEAGVRNLEREIGTVCRKITKLAAMRQKYPKRISAKLVEKYLGPQYIIDSHLNQEDNIGVVTGLVWTSGGGDIQLIEAALVAGKGTLTLTGSLGDVLQESAQIAWHYMRSIAHNLDVLDDDFDNYDVHIHLPEGAVPKDGPSAGITLATAIVSVFTERKVRCDWAMTGEVTLRGHILPVGGVKEKVLGARRRGIKQIILPADNEKDVIDIPKKALRDMTIRFVRHMSEVLAVVLMDAPEQRERDLSLIEIGANDQDMDN